MPVRRDREGRWRYQKVVRLPDGRKVRVCGTPTLNTKLEAEREEREHIRRVIEGKEAKEVPTLTKFVEGPGGWLETYPIAIGNRPSSIREKEVHWRFHIKPALGHKRLDEIKREALDAFFAKVRQSARRGRNKQDGRTLSSKSVKNVRTTLRRILMSAVEWEILDRMPMLPKVKVSDSPWDFLTKEETAILLDVVPDPERRTLLLFAIRTGARAGEEIALEWGDLDFANGFVKFSRSSTRGQVGPTKTGRERKIPLTAELAAALKAIRHLRSKLVFCNDDGSALSLDQLHERLWTACRKAGLRKIRWHDLRHSFGSQLAAAGVPLRQVQEWMGHSTITMTMRYMHLAPGGGRELIGVLDTCRAKPVQNELAERGK
jgi:integrase